MIHLFYEFIYLITEPVHVSRSFLLFVNDKTIPQIFLTPVTTSLIWSSTLQRSCKKSIKWASITDRKWENLTFGYFWHTCKWCSFILGAPSNRRQVLHIQDISLRAPASQHPSQLLLLDEEIQGYVIHLSELGKLRGEWGEQRSEFAHQYYFKIKNHNT